MRYLFLIASILFSTTTAQAADMMTAPKIAILDVFKIEKMALGVTDLRKQRDTYFKKYHAEAKEKEKKLKKEYEELEKQKAILSSDVFKDKQKAFAEKIARSNKDMQAKTKKLDHAFIAAMNHFKTDIVKPVVQEEALAKGADLVLSNTMVIFSAPAFNITEGVLARLNKKHPTLDLKLSK